MLSNCPCFSFYKPVVLYINKIQFYFLESLEQNWLTLINLVVLCCKNLKNNNSLIELMTNSTIMVRSLLATLGGTTITTKKRQEKSEKSKLRLCLLNINVV